MPLPENAATFENKEVAGNWSGSSYVAVHMHEDPPGSLGRVMIAQPGRCGHVNRICMDCFDLWQIDYELVWDRTGGGRKMRARLIETGRMKEDQP